MWLFTEDSPSRDQAERWIISDHVEECQFSSVFVRLRQSSSGFVRLRQSSSTLMVVDFLSMFLENWHSNSRNTWKEWFPKLQSSPVWLRNRRVILSELIGKSPGEKGTCPSLDISSDLHAMIRTSWGVFDPCLCSVFRTHRPRSRFETSLTTFINIIIKVMKKLEWDSVAQRGITILKRNVIENNSWDNKRRGETLGVKYHLGNLFCSASLSISSHFLSQLITIVSEKSRALKFSTFVWFNHAVSEFCGLALFQNFARQSH
jgi:hypothetical protein